MRVHKDQEGNFWFVLTDVYRAIGKRNKGSGMRRLMDEFGDLKKVRAWVPNAAQPYGGGFHMLQATNERGLTALLGRWTQQQSIDFLHWAGHEALPYLRSAT